MIIPVFRLFRSLFVACPWLEWFLEESRLHCWKQAAYIDCNHPQWNHDHGWFWNRKSKDQTYHEHIRFCLVNRAGNQVVNKPMKSRPVCTHLICFTMVLFPDSPAPVTNTRTVRLALGEKIIIHKYLQSHRCRQNRPVRSTPPRVRRVSLPAQIAWCIRSMFDINFMLKWE